MRKNEFKQNIFRHYRAVKTPTAKIVLSENIELYHERLTQHAHVIFKFIYTVMFPTIFGGYIKP